jgi:DNA polymerase-3 subunit alpha
VTIGGIITQVKKIRSRSGTDLTFATLDDLEGSVELLVFEASLEKLGGRLEADQIVLVRGRIDHKEGGTTVVASSIERFEPDAAEVERARVAAIESARPKNVHLVVSEARRSPELISDLKHVLAAFPGRSEVVIELGGKRIRLGDGYRVEPSVSLRAELEQLLGAPARLVA